ncbi:FAD-dependent monooxygenase [Streptomyces sp. NRRL S-920]|uniref:FAD-dependent monooxygenase n=1 Tax=Streptomyces sp. NRRL S-920 TaxID=1463921 RepID=UPI0004C84B27|nr:FAD-dependent monooxygenase [Streptomyces sp. NRRL S-920]
MAELRILIVGAGIAGLSLARALEGNGMSADVVERDGELRSAGTGLYLPANAVRALRRLGLGDELADRAHSVRRQRILDHRGRVLTQFPLSTIWGEVGDCFAISRSELHAMLHSSLVASGVRRGTAVTDISAEGAVTFSSGEQRTYDLVVGADGVGSTVRRTVFSHEAPRFLGQICWRFVAEQTPQSAGTTDWTARLGSGGRTFLTVPLDDDRVYCYADINSADPEPPAGDWRSLFAGFADPVPSLLEQAEGAHFASLAEIAGTDWVRPRVVLIGDAAHACSPSMAQGGAMALEDALVLADVLSAATTETVSPALAAYQERRRTRIQWVLAQNHRRDKARNLPSPLRNLTLRFGGERLVRTNHAPLHDTP